MRGEGNRLQAEISLNKSNGFRLLLASHSTSHVTRTTELGAQIFVADGANVSSEVGKLGKVAPDTEKKLDLCTNDACSTYTWEYCDGCGNDQTGGPLMTTISFDRSGRRINSARLVVPDDNGRYEFRGDFEAILNRLCK